MIVSDSGTKKSLLKLLKKSFSGLAECEEVDLQSSYRLPDKKVKVHLRDYPIQINLAPDGEALHLYPERLLGQEQDSDALGSYLLFDPNKYYQEITRFVRLKEGDKFILGSNDDNDLLSLEPDRPRPQLTIANQSGGLTFKARQTESTICISPLLNDKKIHRINKWRLKKLRRLRRILGGPIVALPPETALSVLQAVNDGLQHEPYRSTNKSGQPGGLIALPDDMNVVIVGDLHAKPDNLLVALSQNGFLEAIEENRACLIILGDAVHPEGDVPLDRMDESMLTMDIILKLKLSFPERVFYLRGNHDSFSEEIAKGGVPQGLLWSKALIKTRGIEYKEAMRTFYQRLPYAAFTKHFIACHAAPPTSNISREMLVNIADHPKLRRELTNTRMRRPNRPSGYTKSDVIRFRKLLQVGKNTPVVVGHTPLSVDDTLWENVGGIENHHIVYCSDSKWVGLMAQIGNKLYPFRYPAEPLIPVLNSLED